MPDGSTQELHRESPPPRAADNSRCRAARGPATRQTITSSRVVVRAGIEHGIGAAAVWKVVVRGAAIESILQDSCSRNLEPVAQGRYVRVIWPRSSAIKGKQPGVLCGRLLCRARLSRALKAWRLVWYPLATFRWAPLPARATPPRMPGSDPDESHPRVPAGLVSDPCTNGSRSGDGRPSRTSGCPAAVPEH